MAALIFVSMDLSCAPRGRAVPFAVSSAESERWIHGFQVPFDGSISHFVAHNQGGARDSNDADAHSTLKNRPLREQVKEALQSLNRPVRGELLRD